MGVVGEKEHGAPASQISTGGRLKKILEVAQNKGQRELLKRNKKGKYRKVLEDGKNLE